MFFLLGAILFSSGVLFAGILPSLPSMWWCLTTVPLIVISPFNALARILLFGLFGFFWGVFSGYQMLDNQLRESDEGVLFTISGWVEGLPQTNDKSVRFWLVTDKWFTAQGDLITKTMPKKIQLNYYFSASKPSLPIKPNDHLKVRVKLKASRGMVNFSGFDYQVWLMRKGIGATGSVVEVVEHSQIGVNSLQSMIDLWRWNLKDNILNASVIHEGVLTALLIGENDYISADDWLLMQRTGTSHLIAVSGLHVGFLALVGFAIGSVMGRMLQAFSPISIRVRVGGAIKVAAFTSIVFAGIYSALAGFNIPTLRTFVMICLFNAAIILSRKTSITNILASALVCTLLIDPLAGYDIGFWLSFGAVGLLIAYFGGRRQITGSPTLTDRFLKQLSYFIQSQWLMTFGLLIPLILFLSSVSLVSPLANLIAIPLVTFAIVPLVLMSAFVSYFSKSMSTMLVQLADFLTDVLVEILTQLIFYTSDFATPVISITPVVLMLIGVAVMLQLVPREFGLLPLAILSWIVVFTLYLIGGKKEPSWEVVFFDVGQGTSVLVRDESYTLIYDLGPKYSDKFVASTGILLPYLHRRGITKVDDLVVSHWDQDHAGGYQEFLSRINVSRVSIGEPSRNGDFADNAVSCHHHQPWQTTNASFQFLSSVESFQGGANNRSCVLLITIGNRQILLMGDLEERGEWALLRTSLLPKDVDVLLAGHHGSRTSSNPSFVKYLNPKHVIYTAGYKNAYGHPHPVVQKRFADVGTKPFSTGLDGAIRLTGNVDGSLNLETARRTHRRYWYPAKL